MADQATVNGPRRVEIHAPAVSVVENIAEFGNDFATLAELQAKLAAIDLKEATGRALFPTILVAIALVVMLGCVPILLFGVAALIAPQLGIADDWMALGAALLIVGFAALLLFGIIGAVAAMRIGPSFSIMRRSQEELVRNLSWIKTVLVHSGRSAPMQRRRS
ncbi:hypothetical protein BH23PLA1_BH23PLA1_38180 [soil metagenome]